MPERAGRPDFDQAPAWMGALLRRPTQQRSFDRVLAIVAVTKELIVEQGTEGLTIRAIADRAGVAVGTIYQFFADRDAVLAAVVHDYMDTSVDAVGSIFTAAGIGEESIQVTVSRTITALADRLRAHPAYLALLRGRAVSPDLQRLDDHHNDAVAEHLAEALTRILSRPHQELLPMARVVVFAADTSLKVAFRDDPDGDPRELEAVEGMITAYLTALMVESR